MARLEAARSSLPSEQQQQPPQPQPEQQSVEQQPTAPPPRPATKPPPLKPQQTAKAQSGKSEEFTNRPAHLLVAQLEAEEARKREEDSKRLAVLFDEDPSGEISNVEINLPGGKKKKRIPDWVVITILAVMVLGGIGVVYYQVQKEPAPEAKVDPLLKKAIEQRKESTEALNRGHQFALEGEKSATKAIDAYEKAIELEKLSQIRLPPSQSTMAAAERGIAIAYTAKKDKANAVKHFKRYLELKPAADDAADIRTNIKKYEAGLAKKKALKEKKPPAPEPKKKKKKRGRRSR